MGNSDNDEELLTFLKAAKAQGIADEFIVALLRQSGWPERTIFAAFTSHYASAIGVPFPVRRQHSEQARDAFLYLLNFITLGFWTVALGQIFYLLIARWLPDAVVSNGYGGALLDDISWQVATVIVAFPVFLLVHVQIQRELKRRPELYESGVRRWLTYVALIIAAVIVITDAVWFIESLIRGALTLRFVLDSLVLVVLGGGVFWYYMSTMEQRSSGA